jgi:nucleotide-binding universal stress UspA family protein
MFKHILVPTDGSELSLSAIRAAIQFAGTTGASVTAVNVMPLFFNPAFPEYVPAGTMAYEEFIQETEQDAQKTLAVVEEEAKRAGVPCKSVMKRHAHAYEGIIQAAQENECDLIVMASHGRRGIGALVLGSETHKVLTHSKLPVLVYR